MNRTEVQVRAHQEKLLRRQAEFLNGYRAGKEARIARQKDDSGGARTSAVLEWKAAEEARDLVDKMVRNGLMPDPELMEFAAREIMGS